MECYSKAYCLILTNPLLVLSKLKIILIASTIVLFGFQVQAQKKWSKKLYDKVNNENFREFKLFKNPINLKKIDYALLNAAVFYVSNEARNERGLSILIYQSNLEIMAWNHSKSMGARDFFDHYNKKDKKRREPNDRAKLAGITNPKIGENIGSQGGYKYASYLELADSIVDGWIDSPPHRKTLYSPDAVQLGCGVYYYRGLWQKQRKIAKQGDGFWLSTQNFQLFSRVKAGSAKDKGPS